MGWQRFQQAAPTYERWYETRCGQQSATAQSLLLEWLLLPFRGARTALEVGCGTGHFTRWLSMSGFRVVGLDRAQEMIEQARRRLPSISFVLGDAHQLPFRCQAFDVVVYITSIEFLERPLVALQEGVRVAREGVVAIVFNRFSLGGLSRRWGRQSRRPLLGAAHDYPLWTLHRAMQDAAGPRLRAIRWSSTLFPNGLRSVRARIPIGDVLGVGVRLEEKPNATMAASFD